MRKLRTRDDIEYQRKANIYQKYTRTCKCGARVTICPSHDNKKVCSNCGNLVFLNKADEFKYRLQEKMRRNYVRENQNQMAR